MRDFGDEDEFSMNQGREDMGGWLGECGSSKEMILSVLSPGHRYWRGERGLLLPSKSWGCFGRNFMFANNTGKLTCWVCWICSLYTHTQLLCLFISDCYDMVPIISVCQNHFLFVPALLILWCQMLPFIQLCETGTDGSIRRRALDCFSNINLNSYFLCLAKGKNNMEQL